MIESSEVYAVQNKRQNNRLTVKKNAASVCKQDTNEGVHQCISLAYPNIIYFSKLAAALSKSVSVITHIAVEWYRIDNCDFFLKGT